MLLVTEVETTIKFLNSLLLTREVKATYRLDYVSSAIRSMSIICRREGCVCVKEKDRVKISRKAIRFIKL